MKYQSYLFDIGGVLFRWNLEKTAEKHFSKEQLQEGLIYLHKIWWSLDCGILTTDTLKGHLSSLKCPEWCIEKIEIIVQDYVEDMEPLNKNIETFCSIIDSNIPVFILSNFQSVGYQNLEKNYPVLKRANGKIISGNAGIMKPDPKFFLKAIKDFGIRTSEVLFIDDVWDNVSTARDLGFNTYHYSDNSIPLAL